MADLAQLQAQFSAALATDAAPAGLRGESGKAARRFALYRNNVRLARMNVLSGVYPVVRSIVGDEFFDSLTRAYAIGHASESGDLNQYGADFNVFLARFAPAAALPYLPEAARLDWLAHCSYYAADAAPLDPARLADLSEAQWGALRLRLAPAVTAAAFIWPVARIWEVNQPGYAGEMAVDLQPRASYALVYRPHYEVQVAELSAGEHAFIAALAAGRTLEQALNQAGLHAAFGAGFDPGTALQQALRRGLVSDLYF
ncbi:MAG: hypothetical protein JWN73_1394 [Betaproteobacteria bacterium]|nr:hypothetical protein [Betaproteobacteria bacterium]